ncbi:MAG: hypothetical protein NVSMB21_25570 [Vulcanimicrobiaceae bacterium]
MHASGPYPPLRPLGIGEVLDRAVALCARHAVVLATIFVVYALPLAVVQYFAGRDLASIMGTLQAAVAPDGKPADPTRLAHALALLPPLGAWYPLSLLAVFVVGPLPAAALIEACAAFYLGRPTSFGAAYRAAIARWPHLVALNVLYALAGIVVYLSLVVGAVALALGVTLVASAAHALGIAVAVVLVLLACVGGVLGFIVAWLALQVSYFTCVVEGEGAAASFATGIRRVFTPIGLVRSLLVGIAFVAIGIGIAVVALAGESVLVGIFHSPLAGSAYGTLVRVATAGFTTAFIAIYYFDLRVREEGLDLQLDAERARAGAVSSL